MKDKEIIDVFIYIFFKGFIYLLLICMRLSNMIIFKSESEYIIESKDSIHTTLFMQFFLQIHTSKSL